MLDEPLYGQHDIAVLDRVGHDYRVAAALEAYGVYIHDDIAQLADYLSVLLVVSGFSTDVAGIQTDSV